ncbi:hypothetical protein CKA55_12565 [Arcobacter suis]|uniref:GLPGLI family protein n=1 Tax=Arcobacter suis CECT 7833 TaxID=663365 RepID=A0AAD0WR76_9BACT|nr:hypothetical protein [Arcobacter suis]AXX90479.1 hypothetical protein ASUIS_2020 [Arcobacter suis CECT 7833]RWS45475.1 hypothetical protein CKA55_12565 [Arcobacter suis]
MGKSKYIFGFLFLGMASLFAQTNRYDVKSAIVEYEIAGSGEVMGNKASLSGTSKLYFKNFGELELSEEKIVQSANGDEEEEHNITKIVGNKIYNVDFNDKVTYQQEMVFDEENPFLNLKNSDTLISMGAKKIGSESVLGYKCDIWQLGEDKIWIYNTVPLKFISKSLGVVQIQEAKLAVFNVDIKDDKFKLPPFPVKAVDDMLNIGPEGEIAPEQDN